MNLAEQKGASKNDINYILNRYATSINTKGKTRRYRELLEGRFRLTKVVRIDHKDDGNEVNDKVFDYSYKTIEELLKVGYRDALVQMDMQRIKDGVIELAKRNDSSGYIKKEWDNSQIQELEESLYQIQERMKIEDGGYDNDTIIKRQVKNFMEKVESMGEVLLREEKASLIAAVKQLQDTITRVHQKR